MKLPGGNFFLKNKMAMFLRSSTSVTIPRSRRVTCFVVNQEAQQRRALVKKSLLQAIDCANIACAERPLSATCIFALETVEELTKAYHDLEVKCPLAKDVLDAYCQDEPGDEQCIIHDA